IAAEVNELAPGVEIARTVVVMPNYVVDCVQWTAAAPATIDLPLHANLDVIDGVTAPHAAVLSGGDGLEDGFRFLRDTSVQTADARETIQARAVSGRQGLDLWMTSSHSTEWWRATAPAAPGRGDHRFRIVRATGRAGVHRAVWCWSGDVCSVEFGKTIHVTLGDGTVHDHGATSDGWHIDLAAHGSRSTIDLGGVASENAQAQGEDERSADGRS